MSSTHRRLKSMQAFNRVSWSTLLFIGFLIATFALALSGSPIGGANAQALSEPHANQHPRLALLPLNTPAPESDTSPLPQEIVLNFDNANLYKVIKIIADILGLNYIIDPKIKGTVNIHATGAISNDDLMVIFTDILRINRAAIVQNGAVYHIVPMSDTKTKTLKLRQTPHLLSEDIGEQSHTVTIQIIPLRYIAPSEVEKIVKPFLSSGSHVIGYEKSGLLLITDFPDNIDKILSIVELFDINAFEQVKARLIPIQNADVTDIAQEIEKLFAAFEMPTKSGRGAGINFVPITRINALLVITSLPEALQVAERWVKEMDTREGEVDVRTFIYHVRNGIATELADILNSIFMQDQQAAVGQPRTAAVAASNQQATDTAQAQGIEGKAGITGEVHVISYATTNTLIIKANPKDYEIVEGILEELDIVPRQVLIEVVIAEVTLTENTEFGIEYAFQDSATDIIPLEGSSALGFTGRLLRIGSGDQRSLLATLNAFVGETKLRVLASPHIIATDGKEASIRVGDEVAIRTSEARPTGADAGSPVDVIIQRRDTGTILRVTPHINATGLVTLEIDLEKSNVTPPPEGSSDIGINKRTTSTTMVVQDGETVLVGGLIDETVTDTISKVPILGDIPYLGVLFRNTTETISRIELILLITPHVIRNLHESLEATDGFKTRLPAVQEQLTSYDR
ncbi:MAG TPA: type II secretion system protein GspD [Nitrospirales bacterium]|nr:type II secretion system protein GspD [Nitrospirales bacterium]